MAWWLNAILVSLISFFSLGARLPGAVAVDQRAVTAPARDPEASLFTIAPELSNPAETPVLETKPEPLPLSLPLWTKQVPSGQASGQAEAADKTRRDSLESDLNQWLSSVKTFFDAH